MADTLQQHALAELKAANMDPDGPADDPNTWMGQGCMALIREFSTQGHSGSSAPFMVKLFATLASFEPWGPLTGEPGEWEEVSEGMWQNKRCGRVFKQADRFGGQAYDTEGKVFHRTGEGSFVSRDSAVPVTFPYRPKTEHVEV